MKKVGILGGGQLGRMLLQAAANYPVITHVLEKDPDCPAAHLCHHFTQGDIKNYEAVYQFGKELDVVTIEIEQVNIEALEQLEKEGITVIPHTRVLKTIRNKIHQKEFYKQHQIPSPEFRVTQNKAELHHHADFLPGAHKLAEGGYDGKGVQLIMNTGMIPLGFDQPSVLEKLVKIQKEISLIVAIDASGNTAIYPPVEMVFDPALNLLDYQLCPAVLDEQSATKATRLAQKLIKEFNSPGLFAIEMFVDETGEVLVNETAPRVHNSGHHTIETTHSSQFDMLWRILLGMPLGSTLLISPSVMVNIIGAEGHNGPVAYEGLAEVLSYPGAFVHLYGKQTTLPGRKMGHVTLVGHDHTVLGQKAHWIKNTLFPKTDTQD